MNILVVNICLRPDSPVKMFPIGLGYIVTAMKNAGFKFDLLDIDAHRYTDDAIEKMVARKKYDVACFGCIVTGYRIVKKLSLLIKKVHPKVIIIAGNTVASSIVNILLTKTMVDIAVMNEGDITIIDLMEALTFNKPLEEVQGIAFITDNGIIRTSERPIIKDLSFLPQIDYSLFDLEIYIGNSQMQVSDPSPVPRDKLRMLPVNTSRGCIFKCTFCYHAFYEKPYRQRSNAAILSEIAMMIEKYNINYIVFSDDLTFYSKKQTIDFAQAILDSGLQFYWVGACRAGLFYDDEDIEIIEKMKMAGCHGLGFSLESADPLILKAMNKKTTLEQFSRSTILAQRAGLPVWTSLVFGYPQETPETIVKTFEVCINHKIYPSIGYLLPQPGSPIYDYARDHGIITNEEEYLLKIGDRQDLHVNLTNMPDEEFESLIIEGAKQCNKALKIGLSEDALIKTGYYKSSNEEGE